jgi:hypothetical protein
MGREPSISDCSSPSHHPTVSGTAKPAKKTIDTLKRATTKGGSMASRPFKKARSGAPMLSNDTKDTCTNPLSITAHSYSGFVSADSNLPSTEHDVIDIDGGDDGVEADPLQETVEEELSKLSNICGCQVSDKC